MFALRNTFSIGAANMSLGGGQFTSTCDADPRKAAIDNLRSVRIATVIASGNDGFTNAVGAPGCISTAMTVGDRPTRPIRSRSFSNSSFVVDFFAPGEQINSSVPTGRRRDNFAVFDGTSMATPHVAGAWAIARQVSPSATVLQIENAMKADRQADHRHVREPADHRDRIRSFSAAAHLLHTGFRIVTIFGPADGLNIASDGVGLARRTSANQNPTTPPLNAHLLDHGDPRGRADPERVRRLPDRRRSRSDVHLRGREPHRAADRRHPGS